MMELRTFLKLLPPSKKDIISYIIKKGVHIFFCHMVRITSTKLLPDISKLNQMPLKCTVEES